MASTFKQLAIALSSLLILIRTSEAINCYTCAGTNSSGPLFQCNEWLESDIDIQPESCDGVYGAKFCVKHTGRFEACAIDCFQCTAGKTIDCSDGMIHMGGMQVQSCEHVFEAQYCIKSTGFDGGIGTKRFCSSLDLGNYCNYVRQPGDKLESYRTCIFTCTGDGCNSSGTLSPVYVLVLVISALLWLR